jgi:LacI family transcriptional regulator
LKNVTLQDIASHLRLSKYSISRALSGKGGVSERTRQDVLAAARDLGYRHPAVYEQGGDVTQGGHIVLLIPREDVHDSEFWLDVIAGAEEEANRLGYALVTRPIADDTAAASPPPSWVRGLIIAGSRAREAVAPYLEAGVPATLITYPKPLERLDSVTIGDWEGGYVAGDHLYDLGHRAIAFVTASLQKPSNAERLRGLLDSLAQHEDATATNVVLDAHDPGISFERHYRDLERRGTPPTALFASTDSVAFTAIWALNRCGIHVPDDVSVVGFNDSSQASTFVPKLTTLRVPMRTIGTTAMHNLHGRITKEAQTPPLRLTLPPEFVLRESTAPPKGFRP